MREFLDLSIPIPKDVLKIKTIFKYHDFQLYLVGGSIRDHILGYKIKDYDLVTNATPDDILDLLRGEDFVKNILETGKSFGVINVITDSDEYEIATYRSDGEYTDSRRPDSVTFGSINDDAKRRDLTCNALYYDIDTYEVIDLVDGLEDLKNNVIRTVGNPIDRFNEDKLRVLRCIRFASRFGCELNSDIDAVLMNSVDLSKISGERIRDEFIKGLSTAKDIQAYLNLIDRYNLFDWIFPKLNINKETYVGDLNVFCLFFKNPLLIIAQLLKDNNIDVLSKQLNDLRYGIDEIRNIKFLIMLLDLNANNAVKLKRLQKNISISEDQLRLFGEKNKIKEIKPFISFNLSLSGEQVMSDYGITEGPEIGKKILELETINYIELNYEIS